jgi:hypothetical protein
LPKVGDNTTTGVRRYRIELGVKASGVACDHLSDAWQKLRQQVLALGGEIEAIEA